jgi:hypothetical protein
MGRSIPEGGATGAAGAAVVAAAGAAAVETLAPEGAGRCGKAAGWGWTEVLRPTAKESVPPPKVEENPAGAGVG